MQPLIFKGTWYWHKVFGDVVDVDGCGGGCRYRCDGDDYDVDDDEKETRLLSKKRQSAREETTYYNNVYVREWIITGWFQDGIYNRNTKI